MIIVDSSGWLEYFGDTKNARNFARAIEDTDTLLVPSIIIFEVFKRLLLQRGKEVAVHHTAHMKRGKIVDLDIELALLAGKLSVEHKLPMADSIILATAQKNNATIWTQDSDFKGMPGVKYFAK